MLLSFGFATFSLVLFFLRDILTANAVSPPVDTAPATSNPTVVKQNGHIVHLPGGEASTLSRLYIGDGSSRVISTGLAGKN
jgi:hypothetical protein